MTNLFKRIKKEGLKYFSAVFGTFFAVAGVFILWSYVSNIIEKNKVKQYDKIKPKVYEEKVPFFAHFHPRPDGDINVEELCEQIFLEDYPNDDKVGPIVAMSDHDNTVLVDLIMERYGRISDLIDVETINDYTVKIYDKSDLDKDGNTTEFFYLLRSAEVTAKLKDGRSAHILGIGITDLPKKDYSIYDVAKQLKEQGAIVIAPHPACRAVKGMGKETLTELVEKNYVDFVEVNGSFPKTILNLVGFDYNKKARKWAEELGLKVVADSDAHVWYDISINGKKEKRYSIIDTYVNLLNKDGFDPKDLRTYIREKISNDEYETLEFTPHSLELIKWLFPAVIEILKGKSEQLGADYPPPNLEDKYRQMYK